ncbi:MAG TPA: serine/threonine-protein kinase, partial [Gemmatimonadaceae bacterium]|nr:serine/threonine-protein kinase [Gemmatimonadaceae bacterium]
MSELREQLQRALGASYRIERELGGGGMSYVFVASDTSLGRRVVVKVLRAEQAAGVSVERFLREIQLAAQLQHPMIVPLLTSGEAAGLPFYTMPFIEGESLRARLLRDRALPVDEALRIVTDVAKALGYAHRRGVIHRDIKPENILLAEDAAMVTDFGVAKAVRAARGGEALTTSGLALGTPGYMAPEQVAADPALDRRTDLYALGAVAYEMLAGRELFGSRSPQFVLAAHLTEPPAPLAPQRPDLPPAAAAVIMQCLEKDPALRPATAEDVVHALAAAVTPEGGRPLAQAQYSGANATMSEPAKGPGTSLTVPTTVPARSRLGRAALIAAGAVTLVLVLAGTLMPRGVRASLVTLLTRAAPVL